MDRLVEMIEASDLAALTRHVDATAVGGDWEALVDIVERCTEAVSRGKQVWAVAQYAEYRLALEAPAAYAGSVVGDDRGGSALGPLWEVAAATHTWEELEPHLGAPTSRALAAHERVVRGDAITSAAIDDRILELPLRLLDWEPQYPLAEYRADGADFPLAVPSLEWVELPDAGRRVERDDVTEAMLDLVKPWWDESSGHAVAAAVAGDVVDAIRSLGPRRARVARVTPGEALAAMAWAGASGGAYGRRRGTPVGRAGVWWILGSLLGYEEPPDDPTWGREAAELEWWVWDPGDRVGGWSLHIGVHDPEDGLAFVLSAVDMR